jgi:hypothetical protein
MAEDDDEPEIEISDERDSVPLSVTGVPVIISIGQVRGHCYQSVHEM